MERASHYLASQECLKEPVLELEQALVQDGATPERTSTNPFLACVNTEKPSVPP